jgi:hypothetical protein
MAEENNQATPFTRTNAFSMYPDESNLNPQPMNQPPQYSTNPQYPQHQQPYPPPPYQPAPGTAPYPQPQYPLAPGMAPYPQPRYYAPTPQQQQQQQGSNVVVIGGQPVPVIYQQRPNTNFTGAIVFSCIVFYCCGGMWGLIAFISAMGGQSASSSGDETRARQFLRCSYALSIAGVVTGIIVIIILAVTLTKGSSSCSYGYHYDYSNNKICCPYYDSSLNCGSYGYYYSGSSKYCCQYI